MLSKNIFLLAHMRSRSTLLMNILMANPQIWGMGETNAKYDTRLKLEWMKLKNSIHHKRFFSRKDYFIDQINHNRKTPYPDKIITRTSKVIFLLREPQASIQSILKLTRKHYTPWTIVEATKYYQERLEFLKKLYSKLNSINTFIIQSNDLINKKESVLLDLSSFLKLQNPLEPKYNISEFTGTRGDPSINIYNKEILSKTGQTTQQISLPKDLYLLFDSFWKVL